MPCTGCSLFSAVRAAAAIFGKAVSSAHTILALSHSGQVDVLLNALRKHLPNGSPDFIAIEINTAPSVAEVVNALEQEFRGGEA